MVYVVCLHRPRWPCLSKANLASKASLADVPSRPTKDQGVLVRLGMRQVRLVFPTMEEWRNPALLLRRDYPEPEYVGGKRKRGAECWYQHSLRV